MTGRYGIPQVSIARVRTSRCPASGMTLVELLVVLVLLGLGAAIVAPALLPSRPEEEPIATLLRDGRGLAMRRSETLRLVVEPEGAWEIRPAGGLDQAPLAAGRLADLSGPGFTLLFSPLGTCGLDAVSSAAVQLPLDPLTCELQLP